MRLRFFRGAAGALGIKVSKPNLAVTFSATARALLELTACQPVVQQHPQAVSLPLPRHKKGILFSRRWPVFAACSRGTCTTKWQAVWLEACRLVQPHWAGFCQASAQHSQGSQQWSSETGQLFTAVTSYSCIDTLPFLLLCHQHL